MAGIKIEIIEGQNKAGLIHIDFKELPNLMKESIESLRGALMNACCIPFVIIPFGEPNEHANSAKIYAFNKDDPDQMSAIVKLSEGYKPGACIPMSENEIKALAKMVVIK